MSSSQPDPQQAFLHGYIGGRWRHVLTHSQVSNWFVDFAIQEAKVDRAATVKTLRALAARDQEPPSFWLVMLLRFFAEGGHLGLRKTVDDGVEYFCPPYFLRDFQAACQLQPCFPRTAIWLCQPDHHDGRITAMVFAPAEKDWFDTAWPDVLRIGGRSFQVSYYKAGSFDPLEWDSTSEQEAGLQSYRSSHSLVCLLFHAQSPAAFDVSIDQFAAKSILEIARDPYLSVSSEGFGQAAVEIAGFCLRGHAEKAEDLREAVLGLLRELATTYANLASSMERDADYGHPITYPLMPMAKRSLYAAVLADFDAAMKDIVIEHSAEVTAMAEALGGDDEEMALYAEEPDTADDAERYSRFEVDVVRRYLQHSLVPDLMELAGFDVLQHAASSMETQDKSVHLGPLMHLVAKHEEITDRVGQMGAFPVTASLLVALQEVGEAEADAPRGDYGDLRYRLSPDHPWLCTHVKFSGETRHLEGTRAEFLAFCRIATGQP